MRYGVSYYPEHKTKEELSHDLQLIRESGIDTVRMGEFAWSRMEPQEGKYDFGWLDPVIEELGAAGVKTIICTPTACPPPWMISKYPDIRYQDNRGIRRPLGGRRHYCYNHEAYRKYCAAITEEIARHYGNHPDVVGFQIDNEPAQEGTGRCSCITCQTKFRKWLQDKYKTIENFNQRSGSIFWSQEYQAFSQIEVPVNTIEVGAMNQINAFYENPTIRLEFERFCSDSQIDFQDIQTDILKAGTKYPVTTNATGLATNSINYYQSTKKLDCYAFDYYPDLRDAAVDSYPYAFARGIKKDTPFWILEFMSGGGHRLSGSGRLQPNPGALKQAAIHAFAHGAGMMLHFQFRTFPIGAEQLNYAIVDMDGVPRRRYTEMCETAAVLRQLEPLATAEFAKNVAILWDYDTHWALRIKPVNDPDFHYVNFVGELYHEFEQMGVNADVVGYEEDLALYPVVVLPAGFVLSASMQQRLSTYVDNGGTLIATFLTSVKNIDNIGYTDSLPAGLSKLFGITVEEVEPVFNKNRTNLRYGETEFEDHYWSELLAGPASCIGAYSESYKKGSMVMSVNAYGKGKAYYIGTDPGSQGWQQLLRAVCDERRISYYHKPLPDGIKTVVRRQGDRQVYFIFNFTAKQYELELEGQFWDYLSGGVIAGAIGVEAHGFRVVYGGERLE